MCRQYESDKETIHVHVLAAEEEDVVGSKVGFRVWDAPVSRAKRGIRNTSMTQVKLVHKKVGSISRDHAHRLPKRSFTLYMLVRDLFATIDHRALAGNAEGFLRTVIQDLKPGGLCLVGPL